MEDAHRPPRDGDRNPVRTRIRAAVAAGRIGAADGEIRLTNVATAQSMAELGLIVRDLDQLDAAIAPAPLPGAAPGPFPSPGAGGSGQRPARSRVVLVLVTVFVIVIGAAGVIAFVAVGGGTSVSSSSSTEDPDALPSALPFTAAPSPGVEEPPTPDGQPVPSEAAGPAYVLSAEGIRAFLATYRTRFSTSKVVDATFYDDYVVVQVPVPGKDRHSGWVYRDSRFSDFGGVTVNFPGAGLIDTRRLDLDALMRNVAKARRTLNVEDYSQTYVTLTYRPQLVAVPSANIYVSNAFHESGYLATSLDGTVERSYPYAS